MNKFLRWIFVLIQLTSIFIYADDHVTEDIELYKKNEIYGPCMKEGNQPGYLEFHIAPANEEGVSVNLLKILDTTNLKGLLIVNRIDEECLESEGIGCVQPNENFEHSLTADRCASKIVIEVANDYPTADTYLKGLIRLVGKKAIVEIISTTGISIDGACFRNMQEMHIKSRDEKHYGDCHGECARNIRINSKGIDADCPVFLYSKHAVVDGAIRIPGHDFTLITGSACLFSKNARTIELGGIKANCTDTFLNQGNLDMTGAFYIDTGEFKNLPHWKKTPWTQAMINAIDSAYKLDHFHGQNKKSYFDKDKCFPMPWDDLSNRQYDQKVPGTGIIKANHFKIIARNGDFLNEYGGEIRDHGGKEVMSTIFAQGQVLNRYKRYSTERGYFKDGFEIAPSILEFSGNAIIHSEINRILTDASIITIAGDSLRRAGTYIEDSAYKDSYLESCNYMADLPPNAKMSTKRFKKLYGGMPKKPKGLVDQKKKLHETFEGMIDGDLGEIHYCKDTYKEVFFPTIIKIQGNSIEIAGEDIRREGSINFVGGNTHYQAGGSYILKGIKIKVKNQEEFLKRIDKATGGEKDRDNTGNEENNSSHGAKKAANVILEEVNKELRKAANEQEVTIGGIEVFKGKVTIDTKGDVVLDSGSLYAKNDIHLHAEGEIKIKSTIDSYVVHEEKYVDKEEIVHGFIQNPAGIVSNGVVTIESPKMILIGATVTGAGGVQLLVGELQMLPVTNREEDYSAKEQYGLFSTKRIEEKRSTTNTLTSNIYSPGIVYVEADNIYNLGGILRGDKGTTIHADKSTFEAYKVSQYVTTKTQSQGISFPGITNVILNRIEGRKISNSVKNNIAIAGAINSLLETKSATDLKPSILFAAEAYTMANNMASRYQATGSGMEALMSEALNQFGVTFVNGIPVPSSIGFGKTKSQHSHKWQEVHSPKTGGENFNFFAREAVMEDVRFEVGENFNLKVAGNFTFKSVPMESSYSFVQKNKGVTVSYDGNSIGVSGSRQDSRSKNHQIKHALPSILAGNTVTMDIGGDAHIEGSIKSPRIRVQVGGTLRLRTMQNQEEGKSRQQSTNLGASISSNGVVPSGGFQQGSGGWYKYWADDQTKIEGYDVQISAKNLILEGAAILGKIGYVDAETIETIDLENIHEDHFSSFGVDTNFVKFLIKPQNAQAIVNTANAIKGMGFWSDSDESKHQVLRSTISKNLKIKTESDIRDLNRDESKAKGEIHRDSHTFSLAVPVIDTKQFAEELHRIGVTAKDIGNRLRDGFSKAKAEARNPQEAENFENLEKKANDIFEKIENADIPEVEKVEILTRLAFILTEQKGVHDDNRKQKQYIIFMERKETFDAEGNRIGEDKKFQIIEKDVYQTELRINQQDGAILTRVGNNEEDYNQLEFYFSKDEISGIEQLMLQGKFVIDSIVNWDWEKEFKGIGSGIVMSGVDLYEGIIDNAVEIGHFTMRLADGSLQHDLEGFMSLPAEVRRAILLDHGKETILAMYEGLKESIKTPEGRGHIIGDVLFGVAMSKVLKTPKTGKGDKISGDGPSKKDTESGKRSDNSERERNEAGGKHESEYKEKDPEKGGRSDKSESKNSVDAEDFGKKADIGVKLEFNQKFTDINHLPPLRQEYIREVWGLEGTVYRLFNEGKTVEEVARTVSQIRRDIGVKYKNKSPSDFREAYFEANIKTYGDPLGPTIEYFRKNGKSWEEIIEGACRVHGRDLPGTK